MITNLQKQLLTSLICTTILSGLTGCNSGAQNAATQVQNSYNATNSKHTSHYSNNAINTKSVNNAMTSQISYITTSCLAHDLQCLDKALDVNIKDINYGMLFLDNKNSKDQLSAACTFSNLFDNVGGEGNENPLTRDIWINGKHNSTTNLLYNFETQGGSVGLTFGGQTFNGSRAVDPLDDNQCTSSDSLYHLIADSVDYLKSGGVNVKRIDFDIESERFRAGYYNSAYYNKLALVIKQLKLNYQLEITITLPQYSGYWSGGFNPALKEFITNNMNNIDNLTFMLGQGSNQSAYNDLNASNTQFEYFPTSKVSGLINSVRNQQENYANNTSKLLTFANSAHEKGYAGIQFWGMINSATAQIDSTILSEYNVINTQSDYKVETTNLVAK